jgi:hypothetical protein
MTDGRLAHDVRRPDEDVDVTLSPRPGGDGSDGSRYALTTRRTGSGSGTVDLPPRVGLPENLNGSGKHRALFLAEDGRALGEEVDEGQRPVTAEDPGVCSKVEEPGFAPQPVEVGVAGPTKRHGPVLVEVPTGGVSCRRMVGFDPADHTTDGTDPDHENTTARGHEHDQIVETTDGVEVSQLVEISQQSHFDPATVLELNEEHHPAERIEGGRIAGQGDGDRVQMTGD